MGRKLGGKFHLKLNTGLRPIAKKYHEGKVKRILKRLLKVHEIAETKANETSFCLARLLCTKMMACCSALRAAAGFELEVCGGSCPLRQCQLNLEEHVVGMECCQLVIERLCTLHC